MGLTPNPAIDNFNRQYGNTVQAGLMGLGGLLAVLGTVGAITGFTNGCYAQADEHVGREVQERPSMSSEWKWITTTEKNRNGFKPVEDALNKDKDGAEGTEGDTAASAAGSSLGAGEEVATAAQ